MMKARIGVMPEAFIRARVLAMASGSYQPAPDEPKIWFTSIHAAGQVLNNENIALLRMMEECKPETLSELAQLAGRQKSNLSVTLKTLSNVGLVRLEKSGRTLKPVALFTDFDICISQAWMKQFANAVA